MKPEEALRRAKETFETDSLVDVWGAISHHAPVESDLFKMALFYWVRTGDFDRAIALAEQEEAEVSYETS